MPLSEGQRIALAQLGRVADIDRSPVRIIGVDGEPGPGASLNVDITIDCTRYERIEGGLPLHSRECIRLSVPDDFPFSPPSAETAHTRFRGFSHVQWGRHLCVYLSIETQWMPSQGMFGFLAQLDEWFRRGARNELDHAEGPLHPPVAYIDSSAAICVNANTPSCHTWPWFGAAVLSQPKPGLLQVDAWRPIHEVPNDLLFAPAALLQFEFPFEYPRTVHNLLHYLESKDNVGYRLLAHLMLASERAPESMPLYVGIGAPSRGIAGDVHRRRQHLTFWEIEAADVSKLRTASIACQFGNRYRGLDAPEAIQELIAPYLRPLFTWRSEARVRWCRVIENRPEIVTRRDEGTSMDWFRGKRVALWGCGAIGGVIAEHLARVGVAQLALYDWGRVTPGLLVRQNFSASDINEMKVVALARRVQSIAPDVTVTEKAENIISQTLARTDWDANIDLIIDATASLRVRSKLETVLKTYERNVPVASVMMSATAQHAVAVVAPPGYGACPLDVHRRLGLVAVTRDGLSEWAEAFWTSDAADGLRQPEPGCSDPTFVASHADVAGLSARALKALAEMLPELGDTASGFLISQSSDHRLHHFRFPPDIRWVSDGLDFRISANVWRDMNGWIRAAARERSPKHETGGLVFGEFDETLGIAWVTNISGPPRDSQFSAEYFVCGTHGTTDLCENYENWTCRIVRYVGTWHTHPVSSAVPSTTDYKGIATIFATAPDNGAHQLMVIVGYAAGQEPQLGAYAFEKRELAGNNMGCAGVINARGGVKTPPALTPLHKKIGLSLSGGGSRAVAFHLGTLRALEDLGLLDNVDVISGVSGGSVMADLIGYTEAPFAQIDCNTVEFLRRGLVRPTLKKLLHPARAAQLLWPFRRRYSRTHALAAAIADLVGTRYCDAPTRQGKSIVFNACELRTGTAFRMSNERFGTWKYGWAPASELRVADAVAASAAYPPYLPPFEWKRPFKKNNETETRRAIVTDGGVFENLGVGVMEPGRNAKISAISYDPDIIIASDAGIGQFDGKIIPISWPRRMTQVIFSVMRKVQDATKQRLHDHCNAGRIDGFIYVALGQIDQRVPLKPGNWIDRKKVVRYPTDFSAMSEENIRRISGRSEAITRALITQYLLGD